MNLLNTELSFENYVGTYRMIDVEGRRMIVSYEFHPAQGEEPPLKTRRLCVEDFLQNDYLLVRLANVDIAIDLSILAFCNEFGLPCSSAKVKDLYPKHMIVGLDVPEYVIAEWEGPLFRHDSISRNEFCRFVTTVRHMLYIKDEIDVNVQQRNPLKMLLHLLPLIYYERMREYNQTWDDPEQHTPTLQFQYYFLKYLENYMEESRPVIPDLTDFGMELSKIAMDKDRKASSDTEMLFRLLKAETGKRLYNLTVEIIDTFSGYENPIQRDAYNNIAVAEGIDIPDKLAALMYEIAPTVLSDVVTENLHDVRPQLCISDEGKLQSNWQFNYLYEGIHLELLLLLTTNSFFRKCGNPKCYKIFHLSSSRSDKKFCSRTCALADAKRKQRMLDKENPNRERMEPGFQGRKKKRES